MNEKTLQRAARSAARALASLGVALWMPAAIAAQDGALTGQTVPGAEVTVQDPETAFSRTVTANDDGSYRFPYLPVGDYTLEATSDGRVVTQPVAVTVRLGRTTVVNIGGGQIEEVQVVASRVSPVIDVTSTESALNLTKVELERLPVDRDLLSVAQLASGVNRGEFEGASFGGSSVAENAVYINGLNVTDFYNRVGFSSVPYAFYDEFQVKTGGYSVEFGRTTGGVINAITRSGTNEFEFGGETVWEPSSLQGDGDDHYADNGDPSYIASQDEFDRQSLNVYAGGPIIRDKLFFFAMYEARKYEPVNTNNAGSEINEHEEDDGFWGAKVDWQINDNHLLELLAFSDENTRVTEVYDFDLENDERGAFQNTEFLDDGGLNWSATYTAYLTDTLSVRAMYGENEREHSANSQNDVDCNRVRDWRGATVDDIGCTSTSTVSSRLDNREQARLDFQWWLGDHLVKFGVDREVNTSSHEQYYPGPDRLVYEIFGTEPGVTLDNGGVVPAGVTAYVRSRTNEVDGEFESDNLALYLEDSWQITDDLVIDAGLRWDAFDNKNSDGDSYIELDDMVAPRFGFSWDIGGDGRSKLFGNVGRYFLPVANVINIKQAGGFADIRTFYVLDGLESFEYNGAPAQRPILGEQIGPVDDSQGDGTVGDLRGEVDADMDPVYQDEIILGYQAMLGEQWSWGVRGIYRELENAIDDMEITSNGILCGGDTGYVNWVMANPGERVKVFADTDCDGVADDFINIDTSAAGWSLYDDDGNYIGEAGWSKPKRTYKALELMLDRQWDDVWALNLSYTLGYSEGNAEGPVNSDTDFSDAGRTENFDTPWVNYRGHGYLPNDRRHQIKLRGSYGFNESWQVGATLIALSGRPINAFGVGDPFDNESYHSYFVCVDNCTSENPSQRVYQHRGRGSEGRMPWTYDLSLSLTYRKSFRDVDLTAKFAVYNVLDQQRVIEVDDELEQDIGVRNPGYLSGTTYQAPRYAQFLLTVEF